MLQSTTARPMLDATKYIQQIQTWVEGDRAKRLPQLEYAARDTGDQTAGAIRKAALLPRDLSAAEVRALARSAIESLLQGSYSAGEQVDRATKKDRDAQSGVHASSTNATPGFSFMLSEMSAKVSPKRVLGKLTPEAALALRDLDPKTLPELVTTMGAEAVNKAAPLIGGSGILFMREQIGPDTATAIILRRNPAKLARLVAGLEADIPANHTKMTLEQGSLVIDTNTALALAKRAAGRDMHAGERAQCALIDARGADDLRITNVTCGEISGDQVPATGVPLIISRESPAYRKLISFLEGENVGTAKGGPDRGILADVFFAETAPGVTATFATQDKQVYNSLARIAGINLNDMGAKTIAELYPDGFNVTVHGRTAKVVPFKLVA